MTFSDGLPKTPSSYFSRQSRWIRGDVQALRFAFSSHQNASGATVKNPITLCARLRIIDHVLSALTPPAMLRAVLVFAFLPLSAGITFWLWLLLLSPYLYRPVRMCLHSWSWRSMFRQFYSVVLCDFRQALYWCGFRILFLAQEGWVNAKRSSPHCIGCLSRSAVCSNGLRQGKGNAVQKDLPPHCMRVCVHRC